MAKTVADHTLSAVLIGMASIFLAAAGTAAYLAQPLASIFWLFVPVPGMIGLANYIVVQRPQIKEQKDAADRCHEPTPVMPDFTHALAAAMLLTAVFYIIVAAEKTQLGLAYAGYGAYISTLWFMVVRLNANALLPRFLANSAVKASIAMLIGFAVSQISDDLGFDTKKMGAKALLLLIGLFHPLAMRRLRATAMTTFGVSSEGIADLSMRILDGVDDGAIDVLEESGITSVQHLATIKPSDICARTLYPRERVLNWIDQAILVMHCGGRVNDLRAAGIHSARSLVLVCHILARKDHDLYKTASERFRLAARHLGLSDDDGLQLLGKCVADDPAYEELQRAYEGMLAGSGRAPAKESKSDASPTTVAGPMEFPSDAKLPPLQNPT